MKISRRKFVQSTILAGTAQMIFPGVSFGMGSPDAYFGLNSFITANPDAVFIMHTNVDKKTNSTAILEAGLKFVEAVKVQKIVVAR